MDRGMSGLHNVVKRKIFAPTESRILGFQPVASDLTDWGILGSLPYKVNICVNKILWTTSHSVNIKVLKLISTYLLINSTVDNGMKYADLSVGP